MKTHKRVITRKNLILLLLVVALSLLNQPRLQEGFQRSFRGIFVSYCYIALISYWSISTLERVREEKSRKVMILIVCQMIMWLAIRGIKYEVWYEEVEIALWYLFYVPQTLLPTLIFYLTTLIDGRKKANLPKLIFVPAALISVGILTNNFHQLAFRAKTTLEEISDDYSYGPLFFISLAWTMILMIAAIYNAYRKSKNLNKRKVANILGIWMLVPIIYMIYYQMGPFWTRTYIIGFPEAFCLIYAIFLEICMESGLLLTNKNHRQIFEEAPIMAEITDEKGNTYQKTRICPRITDYQKEQLLDKSSVVSDGFELKKSKLHGGYVYWFNDISEILRINSSLQNVGESLNEENSLLKAEIELKEKRASIEEQNRIYDTITKVLADKSELMQELLNDSTKIGKALFIAAYLKRKANLVILSWQESETDIRELGLCINESFSYLALNGCVCNCIVSGDGKVPATEIAEIYDCFEEVMEERYDKTQACLCNIKYEDNRLSIRLQIELEDTVFVTISNGEVHYE